MREIHYIDIDEEIITAVSRLRQSSQRENVFVFPKRALILQSIVNLRLIEREATKLGKTIIVMTQDEAGKKLAEKAGLVIENYRDRAQLDEAAADPAQEMPLTAFATPTPAQAPKPEAEQSLGSTDFYVPGGDIRPAVVAPAPARPPIAPVAPARPLHIRNANPIRLPSLNSLRGDVVPLAKPAPASLPRPVPVPPASVPIPPLNPGRLGRFMQKQDRLPGEHSPSGPAKASPVRQPHPSQSATNSKFSSGFRHGANVGLAALSLGLIALIAFGAWYVLFPQAVVTALPQSAEQVIRLEANGVTDPAQRAGESFPVRVWGIEKSMTVSEAATGTGAGAETAKARGTIRIYNDFSQSSQPLVATTRFEAPDGKIFRLVQSVVVPGVNEKDGKRERGMIEATVVADLAGPEFNIGATRFTIPGFKGSQKYEKFTAESTQSFAGGSVSGTTDQKVVSLDDKARAAAKASEEIKAYVLNEVKATLAPGEVAIAESLQINRSSETTTPPLGAGATNFSYEGRYSAQMFIISETAVRERIQKERATSGGVTLAPKEYDIRYTALLPKYESGRIDMTIESTVRFQAELDAEKLEGALLGLDEAGIREFLKIHPEIERLQVEFDPQLFISTLPRDADRVEVKIVSGAVAED